MLIQALQRYRPFSRVYGTKCVIPKTLFSACIYPTKIQFDKWEVSFSLSGPIQNFLIVTDLEKGKIKVSGKAANGYFSYEIYAADTSVWLHPKRLPTWELSLQGKRQVVKRPIPLPLSVTHLLPASKERLFLGVTKQQDFDQIRSRFDLREIIPLWHKLAGFLPEVEEVCEDPKEFLENGFLAGFSGIFSPEKTDLFHQNISFTCNPSTILPQGRAVIRSLFFRSEKNSVFLLPHLFSSFLCGKMTDVSCALGMFSFEWTKGLLRKVIFTAKKEERVKFELQSGIKTFRVRKGKKDQGRKYLRDEMLYVFPNETYYLDRFQK